MEFSYKDDIINYPIGIQNSKNYLEIRLKELKNK